MREWPETVDTVGSLIEKLKQYPINMPVGIYYNPFDEIEMKILIKTDDNYPYDRPDFRYLNIE